MEINIKTSNLDDIKILNKYKNKIYNENDNYIITEYSFKEDYIELNYIDKFYIKKQYSLSINFKPVFNEYFLIYNYYIKNENIIHINDLAPNSLGIIFTPIIKIIRKKTILYEYFLINNPKYCIIEYYNNSYYDNKLSIQTLIDMKLLKF